MPFGGGSPGLPLSGGTLTGQVALNNSDRTLVPLTIKGTATQAQWADLLDIYTQSGDTTPVLQLTAGGALYIDGGDSVSGTVIVRDEGSSTGRTTIDSQAGVEIRAGFVSHGPLVYKGSSGATVFSVAHDGSLTTAPAASSTPSLALGSAYQNTLGYDILLVVYLSCTVNTSVVMQLGVGPTTTPTQQTIITGLTATGVWTVPIYLPASYYALLSKSGTGTVAIDGQIAMPV